jgi:NAD(P)-dependent dehydrogenase (short-subunit alcohol dehydrogenase family)
MTKRSFLIFSTFMFLIILVSASSASDEVPLRAQHRVEIEHLMWSYIQAIDSHNPVAFITTFTPDGQFGRADVTMTAQVEEMVNTAIQSYGRLDYAHNNAGIEYNRASIVDCTEEDWMRVMNINLNSVWRCMK